MHLEATAVLLGLQDLGGKLTTGSHIDVILGDTKTGPQRCPFLFPAGVLRLVFGVAWAEPDRSCSIGFLQDFYKRSVAHAH